MRLVKEVIFECFKDLNPKNVLDLGCGDGLRSKNFLNKGSKITGVDKIEQKLPPEIKFILSDIRKFNFDKKYDLIITSLVLHFLTKEDALEIIEKIKKNTLEGGYNFLICMSKEDDYAENNPLDFYVSEKELKDLYSDWKIIKNEQCSSKPHQHGNGEVHKHKIIVFLAKKS